ncbi:evolutionarily conserved C-terminal region 5 [Quillaja saponaria]|uniref:YTH domain-containing family protein n=1 Tax=Quillaja saponaria TaxID=32244 RepID=A0AAD7M3S4_QUISA|nr:evolutionarily conserved C-terminal region 5 [Quillaja saponaria]
MDAVNRGPPRGITEEPISLQAGYDSSSSNWDGYSQYVNSDNLHVVSPIIYNDNSSLLFHSAYGINPEVAYGQYSPVPTPLPSIMVDVPVSPTELITPDSGSIDNMLFGPGSGYLVNVGSFGGGNFSGNLSFNHVTSSAAYPQAVGILGSYEHNVGQISQRQRSLQKFGLVSNTFSGRYPFSSSYQSSTFGGGSISYSVSSDQSQAALDMGRIRERDRSSICAFNDSRAFFTDCNQGPRASRMTRRSTTREGSSLDISKKGSSTFGISLDLYNQVDFSTDYENAKFFIIKSFREDHVHKSIKYNVWASTPHGNKKLDAAYNETKENRGNFPVFLFFSVNASGQFCGIAEMVGPVDFEKDADHWQQDRWSGQFPVRWHIIKDVPNLWFRHILLENNDNKPVTHSRNSQEVNLKHGTEMLKLFKDHDACTSILDDFDFYDQQERTLKERKGRHQAFTTRGTLDLVPDDSLNQISDSFTQLVRLLKQL